MSIIAVIIAFVLAAVLAIAVPVAIGVYVYKDAKERHMNPVLWTVIAVLAPGFIGFIIYLIARNDHPALSCPKCGHGISESFAVCPSCGYSLKNNCPFCINKGEYADLTGFSAEKICASIRRIPSICGASFGACAIMVASRLPMR